MILFYHNLDDRPRWLSRMHVRLVIRRSRVRSPPDPTAFFRTDWSWNTFYSHSLPSPDSRAVVSFWCRLIMKYFLQSFPPFRWFKKGSCQFLVQIDHEIIFTVILSLPLNLGGQLSVSGADWSWNTFYSHSLPSAESRRAVVSFWCRLTMKYFFTLIHYLPRIQEGQLSVSGADWSWNSFYSNSLPSAESRRAVVSFWCRLIMKYFLQSFSPFRWI